MQLSFLDISHLFDALLASRSLQQKCIFQSNLVSDKDLPQQKSISIIAIKETLSSSFICEAHWASGPQWLKIVKNVSYEKYTFSERSEPKIVIFSCWNFRIFILVKYHIWYHFLTTISCWAIYEWFPNRVNQFAEVIINFPIAVFCYSKRCAKKKALSVSATQLLYFWTTCSSMISSVFFSRFIIRIRPTALASILCLADH